MRTSNVEKLRAVAARLTDEEAADDLANIPPIPKRLLGALIEHAFPATPPRALVYAEEMTDIADWLTALAKVGECQNRYEPLLATAGAWAEWACDREDVFGDAHRDLLRGIAVYFLRTNASTAADTLDDGTVEGGPS